MESGSYTFSWRWAGRTIETGYDLHGDPAALPLLLLPAMSTISTRAEMAPLAHALGERRSIAVDWPGFGDQPRPALDLSPEICRRFLVDFIVHLRARAGLGPMPVAAAGHSAAYVLGHEAQRSGSFTYLILLAPTWRGPLPTVMGGRKRVQERVRALVHSRLLGPLIYRLNTAPPVVRAMLRSHVVADRARLTPAFLAAKMRIVRQPNARFASACFVTGALDPMPDRAAFLAAARSVRAPMLLVYGADTPPRSGAEMAALADLPGIVTHRLEHGALGLHEEMAEAVAPLIERFLQPATAAARPAG